MSTITDQLGRVLAGRYRLEAGLGTGASAHVYRAVDTRLGRVVALKLLHPGLGDDESFLRRFRAEAQTVAALSHPNLVRVFDWGWEHGEPFLVLEYLSGGSLRDLLDDGARLSAAQAAQVGAEAARGLAHAHRRGLLHRDIKPANLLFDEEGGLRVADFGLARALADAAWTEPAGTVLGTARYASPEQAEGRPLDGRSDVYSLALVLYEAVTGSVPFSSDTTLGTLMARVGASLPHHRALGALYPVLVQATLPDTLARLDASDLGLELELLVRQLGQPPRLALRESAAAARAAVGPSKAATEHLVLPPRPVLYDDLDDVTEMGQGAAASDVHGGRRNAGSRPHRPGRLRRRLVALAVVAVLLAAGAFGAVRYVVYGHVVPSVTSLSLTSAKARLSQAGLHPEVRGQGYSLQVPSGEVLSQHPGAGQRLRAQAVVALMVSLGPAPVGVPAVVALAEAQAEQDIRAAHLSPEARLAYSETVAKGIVMVQSPAKGNHRRNSRVILVVSLGPKPRTIPSLSSSTWPQASAALRTLRLVPSEQQDYSTSVPAGQVISTTPAEGSGGVAVGTTVQVLVSRGPQLVAVPSVSGQTIATAVANLRSAGLQVTEVVGPPFATQATTTDPAPGAEVAPGASLTLYTQ